MDRDEEDKVLVQTIIAMATSLGIQTVAEGIETEAHKQALEALGCTYGQGYLISKPLYADDLVKFLGQYQA